MKNIDAIHFISRILVDIPVSAGACYTSYVCFKTVLPAVRHLLFIICITCNCICICICTSIICISGRSSLLYELTMVCTCFKTVLPAVCHLFCIIYIILLIICICILLYVSVSAGACYMSQPWCAVLPAVCHLLCIIYQTVFYHAVLKLICSNKK